jgi:plasmid replication initiation protein
MSQLFLPERHPVRDFFVLDALDVAPRSDMASMEHPIFSLSTKPETRPLKYTHGENSLEIIPSALGLLTVFDKDVLIYCISRLIAMQNAGHEIGPCIRLTTHDLLVQTNRPTNDLGYERLAPALDRLRCVSVKTNIKTGDTITTRGFGLISEYEYNRQGSMFADRLRYLEIELSPWLFRAIEACEVLPISRNYFRLRRPLDRRIYELARKHCGQQNHWRVSLEVLQKKSGSNSPVKKFAFFIRHLTASNHLPDYTMTLEEDRVVFWRRAGQGAQANRQGGPTTHSAADGAQAAVLEPAPLTPAHKADRRILVSSRAMGQLCELAPGWDKYMLEHAYIAWAKDKDAARDEDTRFLSWVRSYTKGKPSP